MTEIRPAAVAVIDQTGRCHYFDADDWSGEGDGGIEVTRDGKRVASFAPGYLAIYKTSARAAAPVVRVPADEEGPEGSDAQ